MSGGWNALWLSPDARCRISAREAIPGLDLRAAYFTMIRRLRSVGLKSCAANASARSVASSGGSKIVKTIIEFDQSLEQAFEFLLLADHLAKFLQD